ncbi:PP2C family protein-serine/threonine phosphatase [Spirochaeta thermophila]|uniref:Sigma factor sigB regulation protein n=1 Tax=Winmispira thermophila (strain ATCC 49972 / DSM 6192 / RI 19.B1) TaxID=665571 RepID=E0RRQ1_WINT6|nr:GAF domain-containing SpoIIE family protein phosphatase [Spirochaeta thermophila]ADN03155.1 sigma factor sigB regulation protein [Spirochaeta thermophila DSM 6192]
MLGTGYTLRIFIEIVLLVFSFYWTRRIPDRALRPLLFIPALFLLRDILILFLPWQSINLLVDLLSFLLLVRWIRAYSGPRKADIPVFTVGFTLGLLLAVLEISGIQPLLFFTAVVPLLLLAIYFMVEYSQITIHNTEGAEDIIAIRPVALPLFGLPPLLFSLFGYSTTRVGQYIPLFPLLFLGVLYSYYIHRYLSQQEHNVGALTADIERLFDFMRRVSTVARSELNMDEILQYVAESAMQNTDADGAAILIVDEYDPSSLRVRAVSGFYPPPFPVPSMVKTKSSAFEEYFRSQPVPIAGDNVLAETVREVKPVFIRNSAQDERLKYNRGDDLLYISSYISVPLIASNRVFGVLSVSKRRRNRYFTQNDFTHIQTFADYASLMIDMVYTYLELIEKREMEREVNIAAEIQQKLIPQSMPSMPGVSLNVYSVPLHGVSGDYYDIFALNEHKLGLFMCDVAGKGVPAALIMVMIHSILHLIATPQRDPAVTITWLNRGLFGRISMDHYATVSYAVYDAQNRTLEYTNAAHHPLLILRPSARKVIRVDTRGLPIGIEPNTVYEKKHIPLEKEDVVVLYTDGITEAMNMEGEQYGLERFLRVLLRNVEKPLDEIAREVREDLSSFVGRAKQHDDQTFLLMKVE